MKFRKNYDTENVSGLIQWNYGKLLKIEGLELPDGNIEVHFSLTEYDGKAPVQIGTVKDNVITVDIPDFILAKENVYMPTYEAYAWIYVTDGESGETIRKIVFTIESRAKPTAGVPEPKQDEFLEEVRQIMNDTKEIAQSVRDDADNGEFDGEKGDKGETGDNGVGLATGGGEIFNDYENNVAIAQFSSASGQGALAGSAAFTVLDVYYEEPHLNEFDDKSVKDMVGLSSAKFDGSNNYQLIESEKTVYDHWFTGTEDVDEYGRDTGYKDQNVSTFSGNRSAGLKPLTGHNSKYGYLLSCDGINFENFEMVAKIHSNLATDGIAFGEKNVFPTTEDSTSASIRFTGTNTAGRLQLEGAFDYKSWKVTGNEESPSELSFNTNSNVFTFRNQALDRGQVFELHVKKEGKTVTVWVEGYSPVLTIKLASTWVAGSVALRSNGCNSGGGFSTFEIHDLGCYVLDSVKGLSVGDVYSAHIAYEDGSNTQCEKYGTITKIEGKKVYVDKLFCEGTFTDKVSHVAEIVSVKSVADDNSSSLKFEDGKVYSTNGDYLADITDEFMSTTDLFLSYKFDKGNGYELIETAQASNHWSLGASYGLRSKYKEADNVATKLKIANDDYDCFEMAVDIHYGQLIGVSLGAFDVYPKRSSNSVFISFANHRIQLSGAFDYNTAKVQGVSSSKFSVYNGTTGIFYFTDNFKGDANQVYTLNVRRIKDVVTIWVTGYDGILTLALYGCVGDGVSLMANRYNNTGGSFRAVTFQQLEYARYDVLDNEKNTFRIINKPSIGTRLLGYCATSNGRGCRALLKSSDSGGERNTSYGSYAFTRGCNNQAGYCAVSTGKDSDAAGFISRVHGLGLKSTRQCQEITGSFNVIDTEEKYLEIVGNGTSNSKRSNARTLDEDGNAWYAGDVFVGKDNEKLATEQYAKSIAATFVAEYRVTPFADIRKAYDEGKRVVLVETISDGLADCVRSLVHITANTIYFGRILASLKYIDEVTVTSADVWTQKQTNYVTPDQIPIVKHIVTSKAGSFKCQPNTTYTLYCTDGEATIHGYGVYNQDTDGSQLELTAKSLSVSCGGIADAYELADGTIVADKNSDRAKWFATGVDTGILTPSINVRRGIVMHTSDQNMQTHYAIISYPEECTIIIQTSKV